MATRAKYNLVRQEDKKEDKPDTDILMRFCPSYGTTPLTQVATSPGPSTSSLVKARLSSPSRLLTVSLTRPSGSPKSSSAEFKDSIRSLKSRNARLLMSTSPGKKASSESRRSAS